MLSPKHCLYFNKRAIKIGARNFWPSYHYNSVVQTASNWNLQKLLKSELYFMRYCNFSLGTIKPTGVKSPASQNCTGKKEHTLPIKTTPKPNGTLHVPGNLYCDQTTPWQGVYFFTNTVKK